MRIPVIYKIVSPIILVTFVITSCTPPYRVDIEQEQYSNVPVVQIGKGTPRVGFLDADYRPTDKDTGRMAMVVENNEQAKGVLVLAEIRDNHYDNDIAVRIMSKEDDFLLSLFYHSGEDFPYKLAMSARGEDITGRFSPYDAASQTYSVELFDDEGESRLFNGLVLNKGVFDLYEPDSALTSTQNARLEKTIISLALYNSMAIQMNEEDGAIYRGIFKKILKIVVFVAVIALVAAVIVAAPAAVTVLGAVLGTPVTATAVITATIPIAIAVADIVVALIPDNSRPIGPVGNPHESPPSAPILRAEVEVRYDGEYAKNKNCPPYYLKENFQMTFDITFPYLPEGGLGTILENPNELTLYTYDPREKVTVPKDQENGRFFDTAMEKTGDAANFRLL